MPAPVARGEDLLPWQYSKPGQLRQEYAVDEVLRLANIPGEVIQQMPPPVPQMIMPPKYGYDHTPLTITDVLTTERWAPTQRSWTSGSAGNPRAEELDGAEGSSRNAYTGLTYGT